MRNNEHQDSADPTIEKPDLITNSQITNISQANLNPVNDQYDESAPCNKKEDLNSLNFNRKALLLLLGLTGVTLCFMCKMFLISIILAICFTTLFYPLYTWFLNITRQNKIISSLSCCVTLILGILIPVYLLIHMIALESVNFYNSAAPQIKDLFSHSDNSLIARLLHFPLFASLNSLKIDWESVLISSMKTAGHFGTTILNKTSTEVFSLLITIMVMLFTMFYLFLDGPKFLNKLRCLSPLRKEYDELLFKRFLMISRATIRGEILIGLTQGTLGTLAFLVFGIKPWLFWGFIMVMLSLIPFAGAWIIMFPAAIIQLVYGHYWHAAGIAISIMVISCIDHILRPRLVGSEANMHDLMVFFSTLGGISLFGILGFIIGPVIAALFIALLEIYLIEFEDTLKKTV